MSIHPTLARELAKSTVPPEILQLPPRPAPTRKQDF
jgi:hypothetical protein